MVVKTDRNTEFWMNVTKQRIKKLFPNNLFLNKRISGFEILSKHLIIKCMLLQGNNFIVLKQQHKWCIFYELKSVHHSTERVCYCFHRVGHDDIIIFIWFFFRNIKSIDRYSRNWCHHLALSLLFTSAQCKQAQRRKYKKHFQCQHMLFWCIWSKWRRLSCRRWFAF